MVVEPKLLGGRFSDRARAQDAFDLLLGTGDSTAAGIDVAFYESEGEYLLLVAVTDSQSSAWAARVLREHGAAVQEQRFPAWLSHSGNILMHQSGSAADRRSEEGELRSRWATTAILLLQQGLLEPPDLLALLLTSRGLSDAVPDDEKRRRLREADEELREVTERLETGLRARHPELFDRRGRLRPAALAHGPDVRLRPSPLLVSVTGAPSGVPESR